MKNQIIVSSNDDKLHLRYSSRYGTIDILAGEEQDYRLSVSEEQLQELKEMINELLQSKNKRDW